MVSDYPDVLGFSPIDTLLSSLSLFVAASTENLRLDRNALDGTIPLEIMSLSSLRE